MRKVFMVTHGELAAGFKSFATMVMGEMADSINVFGLLPGESPKKIRQAIQKEIGQHPQDDYIIFTDVLGGSVNNTMSELLHYENVQLITGTNANIVLSVLSCLEDQGFDISTMLEESRASLLQVTRKDLQNAIEDEDNEF